MLSARSICSHPIVVESVMETLHSVKVKCSLLSKRQYVDCNVISSAAQFM